MIQNSISALMGASAVSDRELSDLGIFITAVTNSQTRLLSIPARSIDKYKALVRRKLDSGFWNEFVGPDQIYFIFKLTSGELKEFMYSKECQPEIARLCSQLNGDSLDKTSDILGYLAENQYYADVIDVYKAKN